MEQQMLDFIDPEILSYYVLSRLASDKEQDLEWNYSKNVYDFTQGNGSIDSKIVNILKQVGFIDRPVLKNDFNGSGKKRTFVTENGKKHILNHSSEMIKKAEEESRFIALILSMDNGRTLKNINDRPYIEHKKDGVSTWEQPVPKEVFIKMLAKNLIKDKNKRGDYVLTEKGKALSREFKSTQGKIYQDILIEISVINTNQLNGSRKIDVKKETSTMNHTLSDKQKFILYCLENGIKLNVTQGPGNSQRIIKTEGEKYSFIPTPDFVALVERNFSSEFDIQKVLSHFTNQRGRMNISDLSVLEQKRLVKISEESEPKQQGLGYNRSRKISLTTLGKIFAESMDFNGLNNPDLKLENQHGFGMTR